MADYRYLCYRLSVYEREMGGVMSEIPELGSLRRALRLSQRGES